MAHVRHARYAEWFRIFRLTASPWKSARPARAVLHCGAAHVFHARNAEFRCGEQAVNAVFRTAQDAGNQEAGDFSVLPVRINQR